MHCPQCGQQVLDEMRFCKGCGFALGAVRALMPTGGVSPIEIDTKHSRPSPRRRGVKQGAILLFIAMCLLPLSTVIGDGWGEFIPLMFVMAGLMRMLYARIFQEGAPSRDAQRQASADDTALPPSAAAALPSAATSQLPPAEGVAVTDFKAPRGVTKEMVEVSSVTEHTTELLNKSQGHQ